MARPACCGSCSPSPESSLSCCCADERPATEGGPLAPTRFQPALGEALDPVDYLLGVLTQAVGLASHLTLSTANLVLDAAPAPLGGPLTAIHHALSAALEAVELTNDLLQIRERLRGLRECLA